jgi:hypothetical protein
MVVFVVIELALVPVVVGMGAEVKIEAERVVGVSSADRRSVSSTIRRTRGCWDLLRGTRCT